MIWTILRGNLIKFDMVYSKWYCNGLFYYKLGKLVLTRLIMISDKWIPLESSQISFHNFDVNSWFRLLMSCDALYVVLLALNAFMKALEKQFALFFLKLISVIEVWFMICLFFILFFESYCRPVSTKLVSKNSRQVIFFIDSKIDNYYWDLLYDISIVFRIL